MERRMDACRWAAVSIEAMKQLCRSFDVARKVSTFGKEIRVVWLLPNDRCFGDPAQKLR